MKKKILAVAGAACALAMAVALVGCGGGAASGSASGSASGDAPAPAKELRFVTGGEAGTYYAYGTVLAQYATNNAGVTVNALAGNGSKANVEALELGDAELGFCQSDVAAYAYEGTSLFEGAPVTTFKTVASLYQEQVQIVTCNPDIKTVADLKGRPVSIGAANSGVYFNAIDILGAYGITEQDIDAKFLDFKDSGDSLKNGTIDAAFVVAGAPTSAITELSTSKQVYLVSMDDEHINKLIAASPYYSKAIIAADTYKLPEDCTTVSVGALILAADSVDEETVYNFVKSIFDGAAAQGDVHAKYAELDMEASAGYASVPYHAGAAKYYEEQGIKVAAK